MSFQKHLPSGRHGRQDGGGAGTVSLMGSFTAVPQSTVVCPSSSRIEYLSGIDGEVLLRDCTANGAEGVFGWCGTDDWQYGTGRDR